MACRFNGVKRRHTKLLLKLYNAVRKCLLRGKNTLRNARKCVDGKILIYLHDDHYH